MTTTTQIDTGKVTGRRTVHFNTIEDVFRDAETLIAAEKAGTLKSLGNWTLGQALGHVACWAEYPFTGYPPDLRPPWFVKVVIRTFMKKSFFTGMPAGRRIPRVPGGTKATEPMDPAAACVRLKAAFLKLQTTAPTIDNPLLGRLTHDQWLTMNLRHAELHLSFFVPG